jgi:hypothetical protein
MTAEGSCLFSFGPRNASNKECIVNMDRLIFELNASVEATSLYILLCALAEGGVAPTLNDARTRWNGTAEALTTAAEELMDRGVLEKNQLLDHDQPIRINPAEKWNR